MNDVARDGTQHYEPWAQALSICLCVLGRTGTKARQVQGRAGSETTRANQHTHKYTTQKLSVWEGGFIQMCWDPAMIICTLQYIIEIWARARVRLLRQGYKRARAREGFVLMCRVNAECVGECVSIMLRVDYAIQQAEILAPSFRGVSRI